MLQQGPVRLTAHGAVQNLCAYVSLVDSVGGCLLVRAKHEDFSLSRINAKGTAFKLRHVN